MFSDQKWHLLIFISIIAVGFLGDRIRFYRNRKSIGEMTYGDFVKFSSYIQGTIQRIVGDGLDKVSPPVQFFSKQGPAHMEFINNLSMKQRNKINIKVKDYEMAFRFIHSGNVYASIHANSFLSYPVLEERIWNRLIAAQSIQTLMKNRGLTIPQFQEIIGLSGKLQEQVNNLFSEFLRLFSTCMASEKAMADIFAREDLLTLDFKRINRVKLNDFFINVKNRLMQLDFQYAEGSLIEMDKLLPKYTKFITGNEAVQRRYGIAVQEYQRLYKEYAGLLTALLDLKEVQFKPLPPPGLTDKFTFGPTAIPKKVGAIVPLERMNRSNGQLITTLYGAIKEARMRIELYHGFIGRIDPLIGSINENNAKNQDVPYLSTIEELKKTSMGWDLVTPIIEMEKGLESLSGFENDYRRYEVIKSKVLPTLVILRGLGQQYKEMSDRFTFHIELPSKLDYNIYVTGLGENLIGFVEGSTERIIEKVMDAKGGFAELLTLDAQRTKDIDTCEQIFKQYIELKKSKNRMDILSPSGNFSNAIEFKKNCVEIADCLGGLLRLVKVAEEYLDLNAQLVDFAQYFDDESYRKEISSFHERFQALFVEEDYEGVIGLRDAASRFLHDMISKEWSHLPELIEKGDELLGNAETIQLGLIGCAILDSGISNFKTIQERAKEEVKTGTANAASLKAWMTSQWALTKVLGNVMETVRLDLKVLKAKTSEISRDSRAIMSQFDLMNEECLNLIGQYDMCGAMGMRGQILEACTVLFFPEEIPKDLVYSISDEVKRELYDKQK